ncbi:hypothetical protein [Actinoplanes philippinensis]|uniref:hypothetical protein n=1 Tax=Actinoplanes philippinensis TaxID=35752 RepID=UPI0033D894C3
MEVGSAIAGRVSGHRPGKLLTSLGLQTILDLVGNTNNLPVLKGHATSRDAWTSGIGASHRRSPDDRTEEN